MAQGAANPLNGNAEASAAREDQQRSKPLDHCSTGSSHSVAVGTS